MGLKALHARMVVHLSKFATLAISCIAYFSTAVVFALIRVFALLSSNHLVRLKSIVFSNLEV